MSACCQSLCRSVFCSAGSLSAWWQCPHSASVSVFSEGHACVRLRQSSHSHSVLRVLAIWDPEWKELLLTHQPTVSAASLSFSCSFFVVLLIPYFFLFLLFFGFFILLQYFFLFCKSSLSSHYVLLHEHGKITIIVVTILRGLLRSKIWFSNDLTDMCVNTSCPS